MPSKTTYKTRLVARQKARADSAKRVGAAESPTAMRLAVIAQTHGGKPGVGG